MGCGLFNSRFLQQQRARHHSLSRQSQVERAQRQGLPAQCCYRVRQGRSDNYIPAEAIARIDDTFKSWSEIEKYSRIVPRDEIAKNDFNISPSRYIHAGAGEEYRPIAEIVEELEALEAQSRETDAALKKILARLGV